MLVEERLRMCRAVASLLRMGVGRGALWGLHVQLGLQSVLVRGQCDLSVGEPGPELAKVQGGMYVYEVLSRARTGLGSESDWRDWESAEEGPLWTSHGR